MDYFWLIFPFFFFFTSFDDTLNIMDPVMSSTIEFWKFLFFFFLFLQFCFTWFCLTGRQPQEKLLLMSYSKFVAIITFIISYLFISLPVKVVERLMSLPSDFWKAFINFEAEQENSTIYANRHRTPGTPGQPCKIRPPLIFHLYIDEALSRINSQVNQIDCRTSNQW